MALEFKLPDIGEGIAEGEIVKWLVSEGDTVEEHQSIVEVMTDKATVEVPAPKSGTISSLKAAEGDVVPVGSVIFVLEDGGSASAAPAAAQPAAAVPSAPAPTGGTLEFKLPDIGEGIAEGEIVKWLVATGDTVEEHQAVVEVMTDKATVEVPSPAPGVIGALNASEGEVVPVGSVIFVLQLSGAAAPAAAPAMAAAAAPAVMPASNGTPSAPPSAPPARGGRVLAVPSARRVARELGVDLSQVAGSGRNGVVRRADVEAFASGGVAAPIARPDAPKAASGVVAAAQPAVSLSPGDRETRVPFRGVRRKIAEAMTRSKFTATHFTVAEEIDVTYLIRVRART